MLLTRGSASAVQINPSGLVVVTHSNVQQAIADLDAATNLRARRSATWQALTDYKAGEVVVQGGSFWSAKVDFTSGASFNASNWNQVDGSGELGYAEVTASDTTTNTSYASSISNKIAGLSVTVVGQGLPVRIDFFCTGASHSVAAKGVNAVLLINGAVTSGQLGATVPPAVGFANSLYLARRLVLTAGVSYTFEIGKYLVGAGTGTYAAGPDNPMHLAVTR
jgi:hypothetical protein